MQDAAVLDVGKSEAGAAAGALELELFMSNLETGDWRHRPGKQRLNIEQTTNILGPVILVNLQMCNDAEIWSGLNMKNWTELEKR